MAQTLTRFGPLALAAAGIVLLVVAEFSTLYEIRVITVTVDDATVGGHHGYALLIIALAAAAMSVGATFGGSRPAAIAVALLGAVALAVALLVDLPVVDEEGLYGRNYEQARAQAGTGFYLETLGAVLLLIAGVAMVLFGPRRNRSRTRDRRTDGDRERDPDERERERRRRDRTAASDAS